MSVCNGLQGFTRTIRPIPLLAQNRAQGPWVLARSAEKPHYGAQPTIWCIYIYITYYTTSNKLRPRKAIPLNKHRPKGVALPYTWATKKQAATQISANIDLQNPAMLAIMIQNMEKWRHDSLIEMHLHTCTLQRNSCEDHKRRPDHLIHTWCLGAFGIVQGFTANFN